MTRPVSALATVFLLLAATASADVVRIEVDARHDVADGRAYGLAGPYEALSGMVHFEVDPSNPANRVVTDIDLAPRNDRGLVEFRSNFYLLKPADAARGNGTVLYEVSNRGGKGMLGYFNNAAGSRYPQSAEEMGDGFLLDNGFSLLWLGWQFDVPVREGQMRLHTPVATDDGATITGLVRSEVVVNERTWDRSLADRSHIAYEVAEGRIRCGLVVVHYALCDVGPADGGFCALPGSHKSSFGCPDSFKPLTDPGPPIASVPLRAGSAVLFTEALTHGTLPWTAEHERRALFYRYTPGHMAFVGRYREDGREHPGGTYPRPSHADADDWTPLERRMLEPPYAWERPDTVTR